MSLRSFTTPDGERWEVWEVRPAPSPGGTPERRGRERRGQDLLLYTGPERRTGDRRGQAQPRNPELASGWLVFESLNGRRRLSPPPPGWHLLPDGDMAMLLHRARVVPALGPYSIS